MRLLHISDIHFGTRISGGKPENVHWFTDRSTGSEDTAMLVQLLSKSELCSPPHAVIITGDLTWQAASTEYQSALSFLNHMRNAWPDARILVLPGNHDVDVSTTSTSVERQDHYIKLLQDFYGRDLDRLYPIADFGASDRRQRMVCCDVINDEVLVLGVNSAASIDKKDDAIFIAPSTLERLSAHIRRMDPDRRLLRIFALHHHLFPFVEPEWTASSDPTAIVERADPSIVANSAKIQEWLAEHDVSIVLHGHKHAFHGRRDLLWREGGTKDHELIVVGAGSASVYWEKVGEERKHTCNVLDLERKSERAWHVTIDTNWISKDGAVPGVRPLLSRSFDVGSHEESPWVFQSDDMRYVHREIARRCDGPKIVRNFMSIVRVAEYHHPDTLRIGGQPATRQHVEESFVALHPEWNPDSSWLNSDHVDRFLAAQRQSYRIQHGPRMFGLLEHFDLVPASHTNGLRPIHAALSALKESPTRGYFGLYNPQLDVLSKRHLLPGLVGLQFIPNNSPKTLDVVATFRNLELSFWWAVNMLELTRLLDWAIGRLEGDVYDPGSITMFSSFAEWRSDPRPIFVADMDRMPVDEMLSLLIFVADESTSSREVLREKLLEKMRKTTVLNIDAAGLKLMAELAKGILRQRGVLKERPLTEKFVDHVQKAAQYLHDAIELKVDRSQAVQLAKLEINSAVSELA